MQGRRIYWESRPAGNDLYDILKQPGDYCGPIRGYSGDKPAVFFMLPITEDVPGHPEARALHHVCSPPHTFTEEENGTLSIRASIGAGPGGHYYWHGHLYKGIWSKA